MRCSQRFALASSTRTLSLAMWALQRVAGACCSAGDALRRRCRAGSPARTRALEASLRAPRSSLVPRRVGRASGSPSPCAAAATCRRCRGAEHVPSDAGRRR